MATAPIPDSSVTTSILSDGAVTSIKLDPETNGYVNVRSYGAVGNGIKDDTVAIQNAINAGNAKNKVVIFPPGVYKVSSGRMRNPSVLDWWCLRIPSKTNLSFEMAPNLCLPRTHPQTLGF